MVVVIAAILIATWVSDTLNDGRAWTLVAAVAIGYMLSAGSPRLGAGIRAAKTRSIANRLGG